MKPLSVWFLLFLVQFVSTVASAPPAAAPALAVRHVTAPGYGHAGGKVYAAALVTANSAFPKPTVLSVFASKDRRPDARDRALEGRLFVPRLVRGQSYTAIAPVALPSDMKLGGYHLLACLGAVKRAGPGCVASSTKLRVTDIPVTTRDLTHAAVDRGVITADQALVYRVFAAFGDPRVPAKYLGDDGTTGDDSVLDEVLVSWPRLGAKARAAIVPFFTPPAARGSWANTTTGIGFSHAEHVTEGGAAAPRCVKDPLADEDWDSLPTANGKVRLWWQKGAMAAQDKAKALELKREIDGVIWAALTKAFGRAPLSDARAECFKGGDGRLDIYFQPLLRARALTVAYPPGCSRRPAFILVPHDVDPWELTHELAHAFQFAFSYKAPCNDYASFDEGSATWAAAHVYPGDNAEHVYRWFFVYPSSPLPGADYGGWPFHTYLEKVHGSHVIGQIYSAFGKLASMPAINATVPGGFEDVWPEFSRYAWNQTPVTDSFRQWDRFTEVPMAGPGRPLRVTQLAIGGLEQRKLNLPANLAPLTRQYMHMQVVDDNVRLLRFENTLAGVDHAAVQAFVKLADGTWDTQDWTGRGEVEFCRENKSEDVVELVVIYTNSDFATAGKTIKPRKQPTLTIRNACDALPFHYRVVSMKFDEYSEGWAPHLLCGKISGTDRYTGALTTPTSGTPAGRLYDQYGALYGEVDFKVPKESVWRKDRFLSGCKRSDDGTKYVPCSLDVPDTHSYNDVPWGLRMYAGPGSDTVRIQWPIYGPSVGFLNATDSLCWVYLWGPLPIEDKYTYVPFSTLKATGPITLTNKGQRQVVPDGQDGEPGEMAFTWDYTITIQRVDENGEPLGVATTR